MGNISNTSAKMIVNNKDITERLSGFELKCEKCGSGNVVMEINKIEDSMSIDVLCNNCNNISNVFELW